MTDGVFDSLASQEDVGLVVPVPEQDQILFVVRDGDRYAYMPVAREYLEDPEQAYEAIRKTLEHLNRYLAQLEQHGKARNASGEANPGS